MTSPTKNRILVIDSDCILRKQLHQYLGERGFIVASTDDVTVVEQHLENARTDLIVLDMTLPGEDSLALARRIREKSDCPLIMTSTFSDDTDRAIGLELGADDYIQKPLSYCELLARVRAVLRRYQSAAQSAEDNRDDHFNFGPFCLDTFTRVLEKNGEEIPLTPGEFSLLAVFVRHANRALTRDVIVELTKGYDRNPLDRSVDMLVTRLRRKIEPNPADPKYIRTIWGTGYIFSSNPPLRKRPVQARETFTESN